MSAVDFSSQLSREASFSLELLMEICKYFNTPRSLMVYLLIRENELMQLIQLGIEPSNYCENDYDRFRRDLFVTEYLSKNSFIDLGINTEDVAVEDFCSTIIRTFLKSGIFKTQKPAAPVGEIIRLAKRHIRRLRLHELSLEKIEGRFGKGATSTISGYDVCLPKKVMEYPIAISQSMWKYHSNLVSNDILYINEVCGIEASGPTCLLSDSYSFIEFAKTSIVPKNAKTGRVITVEPTGNCFVQLAYGDEVRKRLKRYWDIDLTSQERNQKLAHLGSQKGHYITVDLRSASNSVLMVHILRLFGKDVADLLLDLRTPNLTIKGLELCPSFFAGMGNGLTFPLEVIVFHSLVLAVHEYLHLDYTELHTYGDDIICHRDAFRLLQEVFKYFGFEINQKKTHSDSLYRESCGEQFFNGCSVTPVYLRDFSFKDEFLVRAYNNLLRYAKKYSERGLFFIAGKKFKEFLSPDLCCTLDEKAEVPEQDDVYYTYSRKAKNGSHKLVPIRRTRRINDRSAYITWCFQQKVRTPTFETHSSWNNILWLAIRNHDLKMINELIDLEPSPPVFENIPKRNKDGRVVFETRITIRADQDIFSYEKVPRLSRKKRRSGYCVYLHRAH